MKAVLDAFFRRRYVYVWLICVGFVGIIVGAFFIANDLVEMWEEGSPFSVYGFLARSRDSVEGGLIFAIVAGGAIWGRAHTNDLKPSGIWRLSYRRAVAAALVIGGILALYVGRIFFHAFCAVLHFHDYPGIMKLRILVDLAFLPLMAVFFFTAFLPLYYIRNKIPEKAHENGDR